MGILQVSFQQWITLFLQGLGNTLWVFVGGVVLATVFGVLLGWMASAKWRWLRGLAIVLIEVSRGTSVIIQIFWLYYALPVLTGIHISPVVAGWIAVGLTEGGYIAEVMRGAIRSVPGGQIESAIAVNLSPLRRFWRIVLPQAIPVMLPSYANHVVSALKETAVVSLITISDLTEVANMIRNRTGQTMLPFLVLAAIYLILAWILTALLRYAERKAWVGPPLPRRRGFDFSSLRTRAA